MTNPKTFTEASLKRMQKQYLEEVQLLKQINASESRIKDAQTELYVIARALAAIQDTI